jgi:hypothetical protein
MKISNLFAPTLFTVLGLTLACAPQPAGESAGAADTVYTNGKIYTVKTASSWSSARMPRSRR